MSEPFLSIVVPAYNEAERLKKTLPQILAFIRDQPYACELIVVNDGSSDDTRAVIQTALLGKTYPLLENPRNQGKGSAVRKGMLAARGRYILFTDADLSTPLTEIVHFFPVFLQNMDIVIGSRGLKDSKVEVHQNIFRETMGKIYNRLARLLAFSGIQDSQCGFKCFSRQAAHDLFARQKINGFSFDAEILFLAQKLGYRIREYPVMWRNEPNSRVRLWLDPLCMFWELLKIRWIHRRVRP